MLQSRVSDRYWAQVRLLYEESASRRSSVAYLESLVYSITTNIRSLDEAKRLFPCRSFDVLCRTPVSRSVLWGSEWALSTLREEAPMSAHVLFIRVPGTGSAALRALASRELWHMNMESANLQRLESFVVLGSEDGGLYVPLRDAQSLYPEAERWVFELVLIGDDCVLHAHHRISDDDLDSYLIGCQCACASSGLNFDAARIYNREALDAAAHDGDHFVAPGRLVHLLY